MFGREWPEWHAEVSGAEKVLFWMGGTWNWGDWIVNYVAEKGGEEFLFENIGVGLIPAAEKGDKPTTQTHPLVYGVSSSAKHPDLAFRLITLVTTKEANTKHAVDSAHIGILQSQADYEPYKADRFLNEAIYMLDYTTFLPNNPEYRSRIRRTFMATQKISFIQWLRDTGLLTRIVIYTLLVVTISPLIVGYLWLTIASFSTKTYGLRAEGWTLSNWAEFLAPGARPFGRSGYASIWRVTFNTFLVGLTMTVLICFISSMAGYALSRLNFPGRKGFLSMTLILHSFPSATLLIAIYFILDFFSSIPLIGRLIGYNTIGGVAIVIVALLLPFGVWLMKGFFDNISWDHESIYVRHRADKLECDLSSGIVPNDSRDVLLYLHAERPAEHLQRRQQRRSVILLTIEDW